MSTPSFGKTKRVNMKGFVDAFFFLSRFTLAQAAISQPMPRAQKILVSPMSVIFELKIKAYNSSLKSPRHEA